MFLCCFDRHRFPLQSPAMGLGERGTIEEWTRQKMPASRSPSTWRPPPLKGLSLEGGDGLCAGGGREQRSARQKVGMMSTLQRAFRVHHRSGVKLHSFSPLPPIPKGPPLPFFSADSFALLSISSQSQFTMVLLLDSSCRTENKYNLFIWKICKMWTCTRSFSGRSDLLNRPQH